MSSSADSTETAQHDGRRAAAKGTAVQVMLDLEQVVWRMVRHPGDWSAHATTLDALSAGLAQAATWLREAQ
jgi:hypothetical protein